MGFNAVLAGTMAARNFIARRQPDARVVLNVPLIDSVNDISRYEVIPSVQGTPVFDDTPIMTQATSFSDSSAKLTYSIPHATFAGDWTVSFWAESIFREKDSYDFDIGGVIKWITDAGAYRRVNINGVSVIQSWNESNSYHYYSIHRNSGTVKVYRDAILMYTSNTLTMDFQPYVTIGMGDNLSAKAHLAGLRIVDGVGFYSYQTAPYTGFETLG